MAALASVGALEARLGRLLTSDEETQAVALLTDASATVRAYTGRLFEVKTVTARLPVSRGYVSLPGRPVTAVTAIVDMEAKPVEFDWYAGNRLLVPATGYVDVTYTYGETTVPDAIVAVVCSIARRALEVPGGSSGLTSETIDDYSYQVGPVAASGGAGLLNSEKAVLDQFRRVGGVTWVGGR